MYGRFSQDNEVSGMQVKKTDVESATLKHIGNQQQLGAARRRKGDSQMERNSVAKPLVFIETAIFFFLHQVLMGPPGAWDNTRDMVMG